MTDIEKAFDTLRRAALEMGTHLLATGPHEKLQLVERALIGGGTLVLEMGAMPDMERVQLTLIEREGRRHTVCSISAKTANPTH
jgi:hypothetical protein